MGTTKRRTVVNADVDHLRRAAALISAGRYRTLSDFVREAMDDKLAQLERELLADEVARYCAAGHAGDEADLISAQTLDQPQSRARRGRRRAAR